MAAYNRKLEAYVLKREILFVRKININYRNYNYLSKLFEMKEGLLFFENRQGPTYIFKILYFQNHLRKSDFSLFTKNVHRKKFRWVYFN